MTWQLQFKALLPVILLIHCVSASALLNSDAGNVEENGPTDTNVGFLVSLRPLLSRSTRQGQACNEHVILGGYVMS